MIEDVAVAIDRLAAGGGVEPEAVVLDADVEVAEDAVVSLGPEDQLREPVRQQVGGESPRSENFSASMVRTSARLATT